MDLIEPKGLDNVRAGMMAACNCICSTGSVDAKDVGHERGICWRQCDGGEENRVANLDKAHAIPATGEILG